MSEMTKDMTKMPSAFNIDSLNAYPTAVVESVSLDSTADDTAAILDDLVAESPTASQNRYDYIPSDSIAGVMVFDDMFVYSFHASDPACGQELNAFDLVRVHMFPDADEKKSFKAMAEFASKDTEVKKALLAQRQKTLQSDFSVLPTEAPTPANNTSDSAAADTS